MYGMEKTTVYLTRTQKRALERAARAEGRSEAELIRDGIDAVTAGFEYCAPCKLTATEWRRPPAPRDPSR